MENKMTKKMRFEELRGILEELGKTELVTFVNHEIELIDKKAMNRKTENNKKIKENTKLLELILTELERIGKCTITDLLKKSAELSEYITEEGKPISNQKISALLKPVIKTEENPNGVVARITEKKSVYFEMIKKEA